MIAAIIQARMNATRLPGKVLKKVAGKTLLEHLVLRLREAKTLGKIVVATTVNPKDKVIENEAERIGIRSFPGDEEDVLDRYYQAAKKFGADAVVRITADCPLMDSGVVDLVVGEYKKAGGKYDYVSNIDPPTYPDGMDLEVFSFQALEKAWQEAELPSEREHVTPFIRDHPKFFRKKNVESDKDYSALRLTVDEPDDLKLVKIIFERLYPKNQRFSLNDIIRLLEQEPDLAMINAHINRNEGMIKSLLSDKKFLKRKKK